MTTAPLAEQANNTDGENPIVIEAELVIERAHLDDFRKADLALRQRVLDEPGTIHYDWYSTEDDTIVRVIEIYRDSQAAVDHNHHCRAQLEFMLTFSALSWIVVFGSVDSRLRQQLARLPQVTVLPQVTLG